MNIFNPLNVSRQSKRIPTNLKQQDVILCYTSPALKLSENTAKVPLNGSTTAWCTSHSSQTGTSCKHAEGAICSSSRSLTKVLNRIGPDIKPQGTSLVTGLQLDIVLLITSLRDCFSNQPQLLHLVTQVLQHCTPPAAIRTCFSTQPK